MEDMEDFEIGDQHFVDIVGEHTVELPPENQTNLTMAVAESELDQSESTPSFYERHSRGIKQLGALSLGLVSFTVGAAIPYRHRTAH